MRAAPMPPTLNEDNTVDGCHLLQINRHNLRRRVLRPLPSSIGCPGTSISRSTFR